MRMSLIFLLAHSHIFYIIKYLCILLFIVFNIWGGKIFLFIKFANIYKLYKLNEFTKIIYIMEKYQSPIFEIIKINNRFLIKKENIPNG